MILFSIFGWVRWHVLLSRYFLWGLSSSLLLYKMESLTVMPSIVLMFVAFVSFSSIRSFML